MEYKIIIFCFFTVLTSVFIGHYFIKENTTSDMAAQKKPRTKWTNPEPRFDNLDGVKLLAAAGSKFALNSYKYLASKNTNNVFFSPASIATALAMVYSGARGKSSEEIATCLQITDLGDEVHELFRDFYDTMRNGDTAETGYTLKAANKLFGANHYNFLEEFMIKCQKFYGAEAKSLDFKGDADGSRKHINEWVESQTENKIKELIPEGLIDQMTVMVLVNAIYFKGDWMYPFEAKDTKDGVFYTKNGEVRVNMMTMKSQDIRSGTNKELDCKYVDLPYGNKEMSMTLIVPNKQDGLEELEEKLTAEKLEAMLKQLYSRFIVTLHLPRFKVEYQNTLNQMLSDTGMASVFTDGADLSGIDGTKNLKISAVVHKAFVEVNEEGTEAAAATGMGISITSMPQPMEVKCDHPFLFIIRERASNNIVFMGRLLNPEA